jgi:tRNA pseudouridine38-40 synthase
MDRYFVEVMYDGTAFHGSQLQGDLKTVQLALNQALSTIMRQPVTTFGASRTDEGVHALSNFYHFDTHAELHPHFQYKLNAVLPPTISVRSIYQARDLEVNARFSATARSYRYRIYRHKNPFLHQRALYFPYVLNRSLLQETAAMLPAYRNFETFSKRNTQSKTFLCTIEDSHWEEVGDELHYVVRANRFLRGMVRGLVGTQLQVARGRYGVDTFREIIESRDCTRADFSVAGHGLYLEEVRYPEGLLTARPDRRH